MKKILLPITIIALAAYFMWQKPVTNTNTQNAGASGAVTQTGKAAIGGTFSLVDMEGKQVTQEALLGQYALVFFGFTNCPDICPTALQVITQTLDDAGTLAEGKLRPVFITVDPERDTPEVMKNYISNFHPSFVALTGTKEQTNAAAKAYKVYHQKGEVTEDMHYLMDHSGFIYLMSPKGEYLQHFTHEDTPETMLVALTKYLR